MKRRLRYSMILALTLLLVLSALCGSVTAEQQDVGEQLNFGIAGMGSNKTLSASELFFRLFGEASTANEAAYLDRLTEISFIYNDTIPDSIVSTAYNGEAGTLELSMNAYSFVAENGVRVTWIPNDATLEEQEVPFSRNSDDRYSAVLGGLFHTDDFDVKITFSAEIEIPVESVDALLTSSYAAAEEALNAIKVYEAEYATWFEAKETYIAYQAYLDAVKAFEQYEIDLKYYNEVDWPAYEAYLEILAVQKLYDDWEHYKDYDEYLKTGVVKRQEYLAYLAKVEKVSAKLAILENLFVTDSHGWQLYASLMGSTVTEVISQKEKLMAAGVLPEVVDAAGDATEVLRVLMKGYADLRAMEYESEHARLTALYGYYTEHYTSICDEFSKLYGALHTLHDNSFVVAELSRREKLEHYRQFVGELYVTRTALDDTFTRTSDWLIGKQPLSTVVETVNIVPDTNTANPAGVSMPAEEVPAVEEITPIDKPEKPQPQTRPNPPYMAEPQKPAEVTDPNADPTKVPSHAEDPGDAPSAPEMESERKALAEDLRAGKLPIRNPLGVKKTIMLTTEMRCPVSISNQMTVTFYAADGKTVLDRQTLEYGSRIEYRGVAPTREADAQYVYTFAAWVLSDGTEPENMMLTKNLSLYPYYYTTVRFYPVTWVLDGEIVKTQSLAYGDMPIPPATERAADNYYTYEFSGWDREILPVTGEVTYVGSLRAVDRLYTITWQLGDRTVTEQVRYGTVPIFAEDVERTPDDYRYTFSGWNPAPSAVHRDVTYTAEYRKTPLAVTDGGEILTVLHSESAVTVKSRNESIDIYEVARLAQTFAKDLVIEWQGFSIRIKAQDLPILTNSVCRQISVKALQSADVGVVYELTYCNSIGDERELDLPVTVQMLTSETGALIGGYLRISDTWSRMEGPVDIKGAFSIRICGIYSVRIDPTENCYISEIPTHVEVGEVVDLRIGCTFGYHISAARVTREDGSEIDVENLRFVMPDGAVFVELTVTKIVYHVTFIADGKVLSEADYFFGDDIQYPEAPQKESDETYHYTFAEWSSDLTVAMGDDLNLVFEAIFTATDKNEVDPFLQMGNNDWVVTVALPILGGMIVIAVGLFIFFTTRRKKNRGIAKNSASETGTLSQFDDVSDNEPSAECEPTEDSSASDEQ